MRDIERRLRELAEPEKWTATRTDLDVEDIQRLGTVAHVEARVRSRWFAAAALPAAAAAAVAIALVATRSGGHVAHAVPWRALPAATLVQLSAHNAAEAPPCHAADMKVSTPGGGASSGTYRMAVTLTNVGANPCVIGGSPSQFMIGSGSTARPYPMTADGSQNSPLLLSPGGSVVLVVMQPVVCEGEIQNQPSQPRPLRFDLNSEHFAVPGVFLPVPSPSCPAVTTGIQPDPTANTGKVGAYDTLDATASLPEEGTAGSELTYQIVLTNNSAQAVTFNDCPSYTEAVGPDPVAVERYQLNCADQRTIAPSDSVEYEMKVSIPADAGQDLKLEWALDDGPSAGGVVQVATQ